MVEMVEMVEVEMDVSPEHGWELAAHSRVHKEDLVVRNH
jgi:hypothetical protein